MNDYEGNKSAGGFAMQDNRRNNPFANQGNNGAGGLTINRPFKANTLGAHT